MSIEVVTNKLDDIREDIANKRTGGGIGFVEALTLMFIYLKLTGAITWSWFWVLSPMIAVGVIVLIILFLVVLYAVISAILN